MIDSIWIDNLIKVLDYENRLYRQLFSISESKSDIIINGEIESLQAAIADEQRLAADLNKLTEAREQIVGQIGKKTGKAVKDVIVTDIISELPEEQAKKLSAVKDKLKDTISKLKAQNALNKKLLQNALDYVDFSLALLTESVPQTTQYDRKGYEPGRKSRVILDIKS